MHHNAMRLEQWNRDLNFRFAHELGESPWSRLLMVIKSAINKGRVALEGLSTPRSLPMSLEHTLSDLKHEFSPADGVQLRIFVTGTPRELRPAVKEQLHRLGREVLINALRHSKATRVEAEVQYLPGRLRLVMRDNGCGLDPQAIKSGRENHWGLVEMRERAEDIGAQLKIWSRLGAGTEVEISVPASLALQECDQRQSYSARA
jgi:signal transduction histidine kinase